MEAVRLAPSGSNKQPWRYVVVKDEAMRRKLAAAAHDQAFVGEAPVVVVACCRPAHEGSNRGEWMGQYGTLLDIAIGLDHLQLAAQAMGVGSCWIASFSEGEVREAVDVPGAYRVAGLMTLGYARKRPQNTPRLSFDDIICEEKWNF
jgi:nitroreductase